MTPFNLAIGSHLDVPLQPGSSVERFRILQPADTATITELMVGDGSSHTTVPVPPAGADGYSDIVFPSITTDSLRIEVTGVEVRTTTDRRMGTTVELPAGIAEISGLPTAATEGATGTVCRDDLLTVDGAPVGVRLDVRALLATGSTAATLCDGGSLALAAGHHQLLTATGLDTGIDVDDLVLAPTATATPTAHTAPLATLDSFSETDASITVQACPTDCWLIFAEGYNRGWTASLDGHDLGAPMLIAGGSNGWLLPAGTSVRQVSLHFAPQRTLDLALAISAAAVGACLVIVMLPFLHPSRRRLHLTSANMGAPRPALVAPWSPSSRRRAVQGACLLVVASGAFISLWWGLAAIPVAAVFARRRQPRMAALIAAIGYGTFGVLVAAVSVVRHTPAGMAWVGQLEPIHRGGLFFVLLLTASTFADDGPRAAGPQDGDKD